MASYYEEAPAEIAERFLLPLNQKDLQEACKTNRLYANICKDNSFWKRKVYHDYGRKHLIYQPKLGKNWKDVWIEITYGLLFKYYFAVQNTFYEDDEYIDSNVTNDFDMDDSYKKVYEIIATEAMPDIIKYLKYDDYYKEKFNINDKFDIYINDDSLEVVLYPKNINDNRKISMREKVGNLYKEIDRYLSESLRLAIIEDPTKYVDEDLYQETVRSEMSYFNNNGDKISEDEYYELLNDYGEVIRTEKISIPSLSNDK